MTMISHPDFQSEINGAVDTATCDLDTRQLSQLTLNQFLNVDLKNYTNFLKEFERKTGDSKLDVSLYRGFKEKLESILMKGDRLEELLKKSSPKGEVFIKEIKEIFRASTKPYWNKSVIVKRAYEKPRGYPGDFETIEMVYQNEIPSLSKGVGRYFDCYFLDDMLAIAVRNRKDKMKAYLQSFLNEADHEEIRILNIGCGSYCEIVELRNIKNSSSKITFVGVDKDEGALKFSEQRISQLPDNISFKPLEKEIHDLIWQDLKNKPTVQYDLIYSIGFADYFPDRVIERLLKFGYHRLKPGGKLIVAHKDYTRYKPYRADWLCSWQFLPRTPECLLEFLEDAWEENKRSTEIEWENSGIIFFLICTKE